MWCGCTWEHLEAFGSIWDAFVMHLSAFGMHSGALECIWDAYIGDQVGLLLRAFGLHLGAFGCIWAYLGAFGSICGHLRAFAIYPISK